MRAIFGPFCFDLDTLELTKFGVRLGLEEKPARALACLIERRGTLVSRDDLRNYLWDRAVNIDFNHGLNKALNKLRTVLGDDATQPKYLETLSRRGYRFIGEVELILDPAIADAGKRAHSLIEAPNGNGYRTSQRDSPIALADFPSDAKSGKAGSKSPFVFVSAELQSRKTGFLVAVAALLSILPFVFILQRVNRGSEPRPLRAVITLPPELHLTSGSENLGLAISPDGTQVVFSAVGSDGIPRLWLRRLDTLRPEPIAATEQGSFPFWSPDGKNLGFFTEFQLKRINLADHSVRTLCAVQSPRGGTWSSKDVILLSSDTRGPIYKVSANGGTPVPITTLDEAHYTTHRWPVFLPDGTHFAFLAANHSTSWAPGAAYLASIAGGGPKLLGEADSNLVPVGGSLLFLSHGKLISQPLNLESGTVESRANIIAEAVQFDPGLWYGTFAATTSTVVYRPRPEKAETETISWFDRRGNKLGDVGRPGVYRGISLSPDGKTIAALCGDPEVNVCLLHGDGTVTQITQGAIHGVLAWLSDSSALSYFTHQGHTSFSISIKPLDETLPERLLMRAKTASAVVSWHPDKQHALVVADVGDGTSECRILEVVTGKTTPYLPADLGYTGWFRFSPDGRWVAYEKQSRGMDQTQIVSYPVPSVEYSVEVTPGMAPKWRGDGRELYFLGPSNTLYSILVTPVKKGLRIGTPQPLFRPPIFPSPWNRGSFDVAHDGTKFLVNTVGDGGPSELVFATNWLP